MDHNNASNPVRLPQELTDHILSFLTDDHHSLRNCALVASPWAPTSRKLLFSHLLLDLCTVSPAAQNVVPPSPMHISIRQIELRSISLDTLLQSLQRVPYLPSCIHHLTLRPGQYVDSSNLMRGSVTRKLLCVLEMLTSIQSINIKMGDWEDYSPDFQSTLRHLFAQESLTSIEIHHGQLRETELASLLLQKPSLVSLSLSTMEIKASPLNTPPFTASLIPRVDGISFTSNLDHLHIFGVGVLDAVASWFEASGVKAIPLQKLYISERVRNWNRVQLLLNLAGDHLQHLALEGPSRYYSAPPPMTDLFLDNSTDLRRIELLYLEKSEIFSPVPWLISIFASTSKPMALGAVTINLGVTRISYDFLSDEPSWDEWAELDEILSRKEFSKLQLLEINVYTSLASGSSHLEVAQELHAQFPKLRARKILNVKPCLYSNV